MVAPAPRLRVHALHASFDLPLPLPAPSTPGLGSCSSGDDAWLTCAARSLSDDESDAAHTARGGGGGGAALAVRPTTLRQAVQAFMDFPHPLTTLTEYGSYGPNGAISRYHNPRNYTLVRHSVATFIPVLPVCDLEPTRCGPVLYG
jgi:hypothetical protein